jgi:hypothetical protein
MDVMMKNDQYLQSLPYKIGQTLEVDACMQSFQLHILYMYNLYSVVCYFHIPYLGYMYFRSIFPAGNTVIIFLIVK